MNKLDQQARFINAIISYKVIPSKELVDKHIVLSIDYISKQIGGNYAIITHWFDTLDNGECKHIHTHIVIELPKRKRLSSILNGLADTLDIDTMMISVDKTRSLNASIQYLTHKNDINKYQYSVNEIKHNYSDSDFKYLYEDFHNGLDYKDMLNIIIDSNGNLMYIIETMGLYRYNLYRKIVIDIYCSYYQKKPY